jgi:4'-phosphopantetheinyl transferase
MNTLNQNLETSPACKATVGAARVDVWLWRLNSPASRSAASLSDAERERANRLRTPELKRRYVAAHACMRRILAGYLRVRPSAVSFSVTGNGKPMLENANRPVFFNFSHTGEHAALAVCAQAPVGVDIEWVLPLREDVTRQVFTDGERDMIAALPETQRLWAFYAGWTRKEAYLKGLGVGLLADPRGVEIALGPHEEPRVMRDSQHPHAARRWRLSAFALPGVAGAVAVRCGAHLPNVRFRGPVRPAPGCF